METWIILFGHAKLAFECIFVELEFLPNIRNQNAAFH